MEQSTPAQVLTTSAPAARERSGLRAVPQRASVYMLFALLLVPSAMWIARDQAVWPWDQAFYGECTVDLWYRLTQSPHQWLRLMLRTVTFKPPALVWFGQWFVPLRGLFGSVEHALLASIILTQFVTLWLLHRIGRTLAPASPLVATAGVILAAGAQLFVGLSHQYVVEALQTLSVVWVFLVAVEVGRWTRTKILAHLAAALTLGIVTKVSTPSYCVAPCLLIGVDFLRRRDGLEVRTEMRSWATRAVLVFAVVLGLFGADWYKKNWRFVWQHVQDASYGAIALDYGTRAPLLTKLGTWTSLFAHAFLTPLAIWAGVLASVLAAATIVTTRNGGPESEVPRVRRLAVLLVAAAAQIAVILVLFSTTVTLETRFLLPLLPSVAVTLMAVLAMVRWRVALVGVTVLLVAQWGVVNEAALGVIATRFTREPWLTLPQRSMAQAEELSRAVRVTSERPDAYNIVGVEEPWLNLNSASFFAAKHRINGGVRANYTSLGYAEKDTGAALRRIDQVRAAYIITLDEPFQTQPPNFVNRVSLPVLQAIQADPRFVRVPFQSRLGIVIFRRDGEPGSAPRNTPERTPSR